MLLLPTPRASESSPLKAASAATPKLSGSPVLCSHLPGSFSFIRNKWIFQLWAVHQKEKQTTLYCSSNACTRSTRKRPHNVGSVNHYSEGCKTLFWDRESCARTCVRLGVLLFGLQSTIYAVLQLIMLRLETNWSWRKPPGSTQQPCSGEIVPTAQASTQPALETRLICEQVSDLEFNLPIYIFRPCCFTKISPKFHLLSLQRACQQSQLPPLHT